VSKDPFWVFEIEMGHLPNSLVYRLKTSLRSLPAFLTRLLSSSSPWRPPSGFWNRLVSAPPTGSWSWAPAGWASSRLRCFRHRMRPPSGCPVRRAARHFRNPPDQLDR
jgi:hypothetical protein